MKKITVLVPVYNEEKNIPKFLEEVRKVSGTFKSRYEFSLLFVDDGSIDRSIELLEEASRADGSVSVLELSRNFGKELALSAGIDHLDCDAVIIMDADLQHPPAYIPKFIEKWEEGYDIVATKRMSIQNQPLARRLGSFLFYRILNSISEFQMEPGTTDFRLLGRGVIEALRTFKEKNRMVRGLIDWMGYKKVFVEIDSPERHDGVAGYSYKKLLNLAMHSFVSFSLFPLRVAGYFGLVTTTIFGSLLIFMLFAKFVFNDWGAFTPGAFVIVANAVFCGVILTSLGMIALYIGHIHAEVVDRPLYLVRRALGRK